MRITTAEVQALGRRRPAPRRERDIQRAILDFLATVPGVVAWKSGAGSFRAVHKGRERFVRIGKVGVSDIIGWAETCTACFESSRDTGPGDACLPRARVFPRWLAIEVKRPGKKPSPAQAAFLDAVRRAGGIALVASCVEDVARALGMVTHGG